MNIKTIKDRATIIKIIREFFNEKDYLEVETPLLSPTLIPESNIETFKTSHKHPYKQTQESYLVPSPEVWLKQFLAVNNIDIFEISKCFRNSEQSGTQHNPEFTMIEYYSMDFNHMDTLKLTIELLDCINHNFPLSKLSTSHRILTMEDAFIEYAGFSLEENNTIETLHIKAKELGIYTDNDDNWETAFNRIFIDLVEPSIPKDINIFLTDFPSKIKTLAENIQGTPWAQRWELYIGGIECGNCYSEERDPAIVSAYFKEEAIAKEDALSPHKIDNEYYKIFNHFPKCSGGAIGIDRLIMAVLGLSNIKDVILFPYSHNHDNIN